MEILIKFIQVKLKIQSRKYYDNTNRGSRSEETKKKISESLKKYYGN